MISAIVLAAGLSTRIESGNKILLPFGANTVIGTVVENIIHSGVEEVIIVTGYDAEKIAYLLKNLRVTVIYNDDFKKGLTSSIQKGVSLANGDGCMICLADMPFITSEEYLKLKIFFENQRRSGDACICVPWYKNEKGNPVIFSSYFKNEILTHSGIEGCKQIIASNKQYVYPVEMNSDNILKDIDTAVDYKQAMQTFKTL